MKIPGHIELPSLDNKSLFAHGFQDLKKHKYSHMREAAEYMLEIGSDKNVADTVMAAITELDDKKKLILALVEEMNTDIATIRKFCNHPVHELVETGCCGTSSGPRIKEHASIHILCTICGKRWHPTHIIYDYKNTDDGC